jgi:hypothetical protein
MKSEIETKVLSEEDRIYYLFRHEIVSLDGEEVKMKSAYAKDGSYIGTESDGEYFRRKGITPQRGREDDPVATIGFCESEQKWYGWSHRAIYSYGVGSTVDRGSVLADEMGVGFRAITLEDAKVMATKFAESVS